MGIKRDFQYLQCPVIAATAGIVLQENKEFYGNRKPLGLERVIEEVSKNEVENRELILNREEEN